MSIINKPSINSTIQPNTQFMQTSMNRVNNTLSNNLPKKIANNINNTIKPINESINNSNYSEYYIYIVITLGFLILTLLIIIYFREQIAASFNKSWQNIKMLFNRQKEKDMPLSQSEFPISSKSTSNNLYDSKLKDRPVSVSTIVPEIGGIQTIERSIESSLQSNANKLIPNKKEVFNIAHGIYTYADAKPLCKAYGAELATYDQVKKAWKEGADWCNYGWIKGQTAVYPTQESTYNKLQAGPASQRGSCGVPGINGGYFDNPDMRFGVNCYGVRPDSNEADERYKAANRQNNTPEGLAYDKKVRDFKANLKDIPINPFDAGSESL